MRPGIPLLMIALSGAASACDLVGPSTCDTGVHPAVLVAVVDDLTDAPIAGGARGIVQDGAYRDSLRPVRMVDSVVTHLGAADARPGRYTVTIEHAGYHVWHAVDVRTRSGNCSMSVTLRAELKPLSSIRPAASAR